MRRIFSDGNTWPLSVLDGSSAVSGTVPDGSAREDLMMGAPSEVSPKQLGELHIQVA
jgi:aspartyl-tRNA synthetase